MKIRMGFVSNSSTSSYVIYGAEITEEEGRKIRNDEQCLDESWVELYGDCDVGYWIGLEWSSVRDNETGKQFKDRIEKDIVKIIGHEIKCYTHNITVMC